GLWNGRIQGGVDAYWSTTTDLLLDRTVPSINGTTSITENIGEVANTGVEFQLTSTNIRKPEFSWSTTLNFTHYDTKIKNVGLFDEQGLAIDDVGSQWFIGHPINVNYDYLINGVWQISDPGNPSGPQDERYVYSIPGNVKYVDLDGENGITAADRQIIGSTIPDFIIGLMNEFTYKNLSLAIFVNSSYGITARNVLLNVGSVSWRENQLMKTFWTPDDPIDSY